MAEKDVSRRRFIEIVGGTAVGLAVGAAAGYLSGAATVPPSLPPVTVTKTATATAPTTATVTAAPLKKKVAYICAELVDDVGWGEGGYDGAVALRDRYGAEVAYSENVQFAEFERVFRDYPAKGFDLIIANETWIGDQLMAAAKDYPDKWFAFWQDPASYYEKYETPNIVSYFVHEHQTYYLLGMLAAGMSKTKKLGLISGFPYPNVVWAYESLRSAAKEFDPNVTIYPNVYTNDVLDVVKAKEAALSLIEKGVDVIALPGNVMDTGAMEAAKEHNVYVISHCMDRNRLAPNVVLSSAVIRFDIVFRDIMRDLLDGVLTGGCRQYDLIHGGSEPAPYHGLETAIPKDLGDAIERTRMDIITGQKVIPVIKEETKVIV